ncbi:MAG: FtsX-like permease family protein [bacterium]|nr:FtsX-like permease family protein [bacterium]
MNLKKMTISFSTLKIAWRNLGRNRRRTLLSVGAIALGQFTLITVNGLDAGYFESMLRIVTGPLIGHVQVHHPKWREEQAVDQYLDNLSEAEKEIRALPNVKSVSARVFSAALAAPGERGRQPAEAEMGMVVGVDVSAENRQGGILASLPPADLPGPGSVVLGKVLAQRLKLTPGKTIAVISQDTDGLPVSNIFRVNALIQGGNELISRLGIVMALKDAQGFLALPNQAHEIIILGDDYRKAGELAERVKSLPALKNAEVITWKEAFPVIVRLIGMKNWIDLIFLVILFIAAAAGIANTMMMSTFERTREFGMLLALGTRPGRLIRMIAWESVILGLVGVALGSILGTIVVLITSHTGIDYGALGGIRGQELSFQGLTISYVVYPKFEFHQVLFGFGAVTITAVLTSLWPALLAARLEPAEAVRS